MTWQVSERSFRHEVSFRKIVKKQIKEEFNYSIDN